MFLIDCSAVTTLKYCFNYLGDQNFKVVGNVVNLQMKRKMNDRFRLNETNEKGDEIGMSYQARRIRSVGVSDKSE